MTYRILQGGQLQRVADGAIVPSDPGNLDRQAYQAWVAGGGVADTETPDVGALVAQALAEARTQRALLFSRFDGLQASAVGIALTSGDAGIVASAKAQAAEIEAVKAALRSMTTDVSLEGLTTLDAMRKAFTARWRQIAQPLSGALKLAFAALDA